MNESITVEIQPLPEAEGLPLPRYMSADAAGCDLQAAIPSDLRIVPGERALISAGFCIALPAGFEGQIRPRSGLALRHGVTCLNSPGTIDADYRGPVSVLLVNLGDAEFIVRRGDRIAQFVVSRVVRASFLPAEELAPSGRAAGGFGSTGNEG